MNKVELKTTKNYVKVYINDIIHLSFRQDELFGMESFIEEDFYKKYMIEIYLQKGMISCEYDDRELWKEILKFLDTILE